jgi:glycosyltransferase involved in cell wall biosynthesis
MRLTIAIPTFNEISYIKKTLDSIFNELLSIKENMELLLVDNASDDGTAKILSELGLEGDLPKNLILSRILKTENLGFDHSIETIISNAKGEYLWILGAQDTLHEGGLQSVFDSFEKNPWQIILNASIFDEKTNVEVNTRLIEIDHDLNISLAEDFYKQIGGPCFSISANIAKTNSLRNQNGATSTRYWSWLEKLLDSSFDIEKSGNFVLISEPVVQILIEKAGWQNTGKDTSGAKVLQNQNPIYFTFIELTEMAARKFNSSIQMRNTLGAYRDPFGVPRSIAMAKGAGLIFSKGVHLRTFNAFRFTIWYWILGLPLAILPRIFFGTRFLKFYKTLIHLLRVTLRMPAK